MTKISALLLLLLAAAPARATYTLDVSTSGPTTTDTVVTSTPSGISCPPTCSAVFATSATVKLTEVNPSTTAFVGWGGAQGCRTNSPSCTLTLRSNSIVSAAFNPALDLSFSGNGLGVVISSGEFTADNSSIYGSTQVKRFFVYPAGTEVVLRASTGTASAFVGWSGDPGCSNASTCTITLNGYTAIVATFTATGSTFTLAVAIPRGGGSVTSSPAGIKTSAGVFKSTFTANAFVTLTTAAASGYRFAGWANGGCSGQALCVVQSTSPLQGLGGPQSPAAFFYRIPTP